LEEGKAENSKADKGKGDKGKPDKGKDEPEKVPVEVSESKSSVAISQQVI
jgi:hypothetical protein